MVLAPESLLEPGSVVDGKYRVERQLGKGGMGVVVEATHLALGTRVALKCLRPDAAASPTIVERFFREARAAAQLQHDHICRVLDVGYVDDTPFLVMELLDGMDLGALARRGPLDIATAVDYVRQACAGLALAHAQQIVHRDLKPENLFLARRPDGSELIKLVDFGVAKAPDRQLLTGSIQMIGSPAYMSPEQMRSSRDVDARTDVWALGVILYRLVSGRLPFPGTSVSELALQILDEPPVPLDSVPAAFAAIVLKCLEKEPVDRYASVAELSLALRPFGTDVYSAGPGDTATVALAPSQPSITGPTDAIQTTELRAEGGTPITRERSPADALSQQITDPAAPSRDSHEVTAVSGLAATARAAVTPNPRAAKMFDAPTPRITAATSSPRRAPIVAAAVALGVVIAATAWILTRSPASTPAADVERSHEATPAHAAQPVAPALSPAVETEPVPGSAPAASTEVAPAPTVEPAPGPRKRKRAGSAVPARTEAPTDATPRPLTDKEIGESRI